MEGLVFNNFLTQSRKWKLLLQIKKDKYQKKGTSYDGEALPAHVVYTTVDEEQEEDVKVWERNKNKGQEKAQ